MRSWSAGIQSLLNALQHESFAVTVAFRDLGLYYTNWPAGLSLDGQTYTAAAVTIEGIAESLYTDAPAASMKLGSLDAAHQARFFADSFRGDVVTVRILIMSSGSWTDTTFSMTLACDADQADADAVTIRLASSDAVEGTDAPRRATQEVGCQHTYKIAGCSYRGALATCDHGLNTANGCRAHFPDMNLDTGLRWSHSSTTTAHTRLVQPLPYGAFVGGISHRLVVG